ncbi:hypothetical protein EB796_009135 [Bugula neritina]|uniref:Uncharacterized protein n=1 Tax=Bugula neritina TaxID=10212 RepID=A0A7J7K3K6_BUGNE|nr:hypothetical protein EB796_009135 [Bugula neritina]
METYNSLTNSRNELKMTSTSLEISLPSCQYLLPLALDWSSKQYVQDDTPNVATIIYLGKCIIIKHIVW